MQILINSLLTYYEELYPQANQTIIFLHGLANSSQHWLPIAKKLPPNYHYVLVDLPGFGQTQPFTPANTSITQYTDFVATLIRQLKLDSPLIFGHSFGGQIAIKLALTHPSLTSRLILLSPAGVQPKPVSFFRRLIPNIQPLRLLEQVLELDLTHQLTQIKLPVDLIWGDQDLVTPCPSNITRLTSSNYHVHILQGSGHQPHIFQPEPLIQILSVILTNRPNQ